MQESSPPQLERGCDATVRLCLEASGRGSRRRAFTLIELLLVVAIVCVLSTILLAVGHHAGETGRVARTKVELAALGAALEAYRREHGDYPRTDAPAELLQSLLGRRDPDGAAIDGMAHLALAQFATEDARDPFVDQGARLIDAWGGLYVYRYTPANGAWRRTGYLLYSTGPDRCSDPPAPSGLWPEAASLFNADNVCLSR